MKIHCVDEKLPPRYLDPWNAVFGKLPVDLGRNSWCFTWHLMGIFWGIQKPRKALAGWGFGVPIEGPVLPLDATSKDHPIFPSRMRAVEHHQFSVRPWSDTNSPQRLKSTPTQTLEMIYPPILWRFSLVQPYQLREFFEKSREIWDSICFLMKRKYLDLLHPEKRKRKTKNPVADSEFVEMCVSTKACRALQDGRSIQKTSLPCTTTARLATVFLVEVHDTQIRHRPAAQPRVTSFHRGFIWLPFQVKRMGHQQGTRWLRRKKQQCLLTFDDHLQEIFVVSWPKQLWQFGG